MKAQNRTNKLGSLQVGQVKAKYGSSRDRSWQRVCMGIRPWEWPLNALNGTAMAMAGLLGRQSLGGTDVILDMQTKEGDPACTILLQHFSSLARIVRNWPGSP